MKKQQLLTLSISSILLVACGGSGGGTAVSLQPNPTTPTTPANNGLTQNYTVPKNLQSTVAEAKKYKLNQITKDKTSTLTVGNKTFATGTDVTFTHIASGNSQQTYKETKISDYTTGKEETYTGNWKIYNMPYSIMAAAIQDSKDGQKLATPGFYVDEFIGYNTATLPSAGKAVYTGTAFDKTSQGNMVLNVDFTHNKASGKITGLAIGDVALNEGTLGSHTSTSDKHTYVSGAAAISGYSDLRYYGYFYGPQAEEVIAEIEDKNNNDLVGFAGQRGEISK